MVTISLCMIVKNEEKVLSRCLNSVKDLVDEIIIIDTGSTDSTKNIASSFTNNVIDFTWNYDFSNARNFSFSKASMDYIMWLDADDVMLEEDRQKFVVLKAALDHTNDVVFTNYNVLVDDHNNCITSIKRERLVKRSKNLKWIEPVHEIIDVYGNFTYSDLCITHKPAHKYSSRNLEIFERILNSGQELSPRSTFNYAEELFAIQQFDKAIKYYKKSLSFAKLPILYYVTACQRLSTCYHIKNDTENSIKELLRSFEYDTPHPYICSLLGNTFECKQDYKKAIFWYELALNTEITDDSPGILGDYILRYIPCLELSSCYLKLGNNEKALYYKNKASEFTKYLQQPFRTQELHLDFFPEQQSLPSFTIKA